MRTISILCDYFEAVNRFCVANHFIQDIRSILLNPVQSYECTIIMTRYSARTKAVRKEYLSLYSRVSRKTLIVCERVESRNVTP